MTKIHDSQATTIASNISEGRDLAANRLEDGLVYLEGRTDFTTRRHFSVARGLIEALEVMASLTAWSEWLKLTTAAIAKSADTGQPASTQSVLDRLMENVVMRATHVASFHGSKLASAYLDTVAAEFSEICNMVKLEVITEGLCDEVGPRLGMSAEGVYAALKAEDPIVQREVGRAGLLRGLTVAHDLGQALPQLPNGLLDALGWTLEDLPAHLRPEPMPMPTPEDIAKSLAAQFGVNADQVRFVSPANAPPTFPPNFMAGNPMPEGIKAN